MKPDVRCITVKYMFTTDKAICEMSMVELAEEYEYCMKSAESGALAPDIQRYFRDRAAVAKKRFDEIRQREEEELADHGSDWALGKYDEEVMNGRGYYDADGRYHSHYSDPNDF